MRQKREKGLRSPQRPPGAGASGAKVRAGADAGWDQVASWYDAWAGDEGGEYHREVVIPGTLRLLGIVPGEAVLDLACGQGALSRALKEAEANVTGVDASPRLLELARARSPKTIRYLEGDARHLEALADASFDAVACILAIQNMDPVEPILAEISRVLRPAGRAVLVLNHPMFRIPRQSRWGWDADRRLIFRAVDRYLSPLKIPIDTRPFKAPGQFTWTIHRPLQDYVAGLARAGLMIDALEEWRSHKASQPGPRADAENRARAEFPLFLALRAKRGDKT